MSDIVERLRAHKADIWDWNGAAMTAWDGWRSAIAKGDKSSWPRDAFESLIGGYGEDMGDAADEIEALRAEVERLRAALKKIAKVTYGSDWTWGSEELADYYSMRFFNAQETARAALGEEKKG